MLIVALVLAVIGLAALVTAVVTSNELIAWVCIAASVIGVLLLIVGLYAGLCSIRMMPLFVLIAIPLICQRLGEWPSTRRMHGLKPQVGSDTLSNTASFNAAIVVALAAFAAIHILHVIRRQPQAEAQRFPARAVAFLQTHPAVRIFNHYDWGGYQVWKLYPSTPVFIDGRADLYALARRKLARAGVSAVHGGGRCTLSESEFFHSYRRAGADASGRMATMIWLGSQ